MGTILLSGVVLSLGGKARGRHFAQWPVGDRVRLNG